MIKARKEKVLSSSYRVALSAIAVFFCVAFGVYGAPFTTYDFTDGNLLDDSVGTRDLSVIGAGASLNPLGYATFDGNNSNYLEWTGGGGAPDWTVSLWVHSSNVNQGGFKGIFSNNDSFADANSWQVDNHFGNYRLVGIDVGANVIGAATADTWEHIVVQKFGGGSVRYFLNGALVSTLGSNPGGLQEFRLGINRNSDNAYAMDLATVRIWNDSTVNVPALFAAGPGVTTVPTPASLPLMVVLVGGMGFFLRRRRDQS